jgi:hypothetical protein
LPIDGELPDGYVQAVDPDNGETDVPITLDTIFIYYNQPMKNDGGGGSVENPVHYRLRNLNNNRSLPILSIAYDPAYFELSFVFDNTNPNWTYATQYEISIQGSVRSVCGQPQQGTVVTTFWTESLLLNTESPPSEQLADPAPTHSPSWTTTPLLAVYPSSTPTPTLIQLSPWIYTPTLASTQTPSVQPTHVPPMIATPTASTTPIPLLPTKARATQVARRTPSPTYAIIIPPPRLETDPGSESSWTILRKGYPQELPAGTPYLVIDPGTTPLILPGEQLYIDIELLTLWRCLFDPQCVNKP